ncbi:MAG: ribosome-associated translation inhibitor RaiA [Rhodothermales bacterium]
MQIQITARHFDADTDLKEYAGQKLAKLERFYDGITEAQVVFGDDGTPGRTKSAEVIVHVYQQTLSATSNGSTHEDAVDQCVKALRRQIKKYKARLRSTDKDYRK